MTAFLAVEHVWQEYADHVVLENLSLQVNEGEFCALVGASGCGKSTTLRMVAGLETISRGEVCIGDRVVNGLRPKERGIAMVFQNYALYPSKTVYNNMAFSLQLSRMPKAEIDRKVREVAEILELTPLLERKPGALSGGQRQRVAMGRAIVRDPEVFLFDEPLSNLDAKLRGVMRAEIKRLHQRLRNTIIYVTHDQVEAMTLADKIVVMNAGRIEQVGSPRDLYERPANAFVATFIGSPRMTLVDVSRDGARLGMANGGSIAMEALPQEKSQRLGLRPDAVTLHNGHADQGFHGQVIYTEYLGDNAYVYVRLADDTLLAARTAPNDNFAPDAPVTVTVDPGAAHFFSAEDGRRLMP